MLASHPQRTQEPPFTAQLLQLGETDVRLLLSSSVLREELPARNARRQGRTQPLLVITLQRVDRRRSFPSLLSMWPRNLEKTNRRTRGQKNSKRAQSRCRSHPIRRRIILQPHLRLCRWCKCHTNRNRPMTRTRSSTFPALSEHRRCSELHLTNLRTDQLYRRRSDQKIQL